VAALLGRKLERHDDLLRKIEARFHARGLTMPPNNERQAMVPEGATHLDNQAGTAPGLWLEVGSKIILVLPGPPGELKEMFERECLPRLKPRARRVRMVTRVLMVTGLTESDTDHRIAPIYKGVDNPLVAILAAPGEIQIHLRGRGATEEEAQARVDELAERMVEKLGAHLFSRNGAKLEEVVGERLLLAHKTVAVAESCTGGLVAKQLTNVPGSSAYFLGGVVCYSNDAKVWWADVPANLIEAKGAVSEEVACALASGIRKRTSADFGLGVTGIAGPAGATPAKPVGLVFIALADAMRTEALAYRFLGDRHRVRKQACQAALDMLRRRLLEA
jgi:nicotinamide-nucleotide amidase